MSETIKVVIADNYQIVREGIAARLAMTNCMEVVGEAGDGYDSIKICREKKPDVLLMDLELTGLNGLEAIKKIRECSPETKIAVISSETSFAKAFLALSNGAVSFMPKQAKSIDFVSAVRAAAYGYSYLPLDCLEDVMQARKNVSRTGNAYGLSPREAEILSACAGGKSNKEVASQFNISVRTVETHRNSIYRKTDCSCLDDLEQISAAMG